MDKIIDKIISSNKNLFGEKLFVEKINVGFTNTIYCVNNSYIVKVCTNLSNEDNFKREIDFYNLNNLNSFIPKLYYSNTSKEVVPYFYEILEKINGDSLFNVWHIYSEEQRENIIKQLCECIKQIHINKGNSYNWPNYMKNEFNSLYKRIKELNVFNEDELLLLKQAFNEFDKYLESNEFVLIHNDLHFDNIFIDNEKLKIIDFERSIYAPRDFELDILYRMIRKPWKFASEETEQYTEASQYSNIMSYINKYYPELVNIPNLYKRLAIYDIVYYMNQLLEYPHLAELKNDVMSAVKIVMFNEI